ncbi:glycosyltransferase, partial [Telmatospirillum sp.]
MTEIRKQRRVAIVISHPIQYFVPLYRHLATDPDIDLQVYYFSDQSIRAAFDPGFGTSVRWNIDLLSGYKSEFVGKNFGTIEPSRYKATFVPEIFWKILRGRFDAVIVNGYALAGNVLAVAAAKLTGARVLTRSDSNVELMHAKRDSLAKRIYVKTFFAACDRMLVSGQRNGAFYKKWGVPDRKLVDTPFTVDNERFRDDSHLTPEARRALRSTWGCTDDACPVFVYASKFMERKQPHLTIMAAARLAGEGRKLHLVMAGSGEMDAELRQLAAAHPELAVHFTGFVNQAEMP